MALFSKKEFAEKCGLGTNQLSIYIKRGNVVLTGDSVDNTLDKNRAFIQKKQSKKTIPQVILPENTQKVAQTITEDQLNAMLDGEIPLLVESERLLKYLQTEKIKRENDRLDIDIAKKRGAIIH